MTVYLLPGSTTKTLEDFFGIHASTKQYDFLYVSFGSKHNDFRQHFHWPTTQILRTNSDFQMIPQFLRYLNTTTSTRTSEIPDKQNVKHILNIVIDTFSKEEMDLNHRILASQETDCPMDILLVDYSFTKTSLTPMIIFLLSIAEQYSICTTHCMFCNYIRFSHPNQQEVILEGFIQETIQKQTEHAYNGKYAECFYQWYGPQFYLYHCLYSYKRYDTMNLFHSPMIIHILHRTANNLPFTKDAIPFIETSLKTNAERHAWTQFLWNIVDITAISR